MGESLPSAATMSDDVDAPLILPFRVGYCIATKSLSKPGARVGYMYREGPDERDDSGWRFFTGDETEEELDDAEKLAIYDVNTIAAIDPAIIKRLHAPYGSSWDRIEESDEFEAGPPRDDDEPGAYKPSKNDIPIFPTVTGLFDLPGDWRCNLPAYFFIRREDADLVLWRKGLTMRFSFLLAGKLKTSKEAALAKNQSTRNKLARDEREEVTPDLIRYTYELPPECDKQGCTTLIGNLYTDTQWVLSAYQCDAADHIQLGRAVRASLDLKARGA